MKKFLTIAFILITIIEIIGIYSGSAVMQYIAKPLLVPTLMLFIWISGPVTLGRKIILAGLSFSMAGDILLMMVNKNPDLFIAGLISFLITHLFYIWFFISKRSAAVSLLRKQPVLPVLVAGYGIFLVWLLYPTLLQMKLPVIIYAVVICTMLLGSLHAYTKVSSPSGFLFVAGALAFVISDSLLAINKFYMPFDFAGELIMITYCTAQYCITRGFIEMKR